MFIIHKYYTVSSGSVVSVPEIHYFTIADTGLNKARCVRQKDPFYLRPACKLRIEPRSIEFQYLLKIRYLSVPPVPAMSNHE